MITCLRTNSDHHDFRKLAAELEADLRIRDGEDHAFYAQLNKIDTLKYAVIAYDDDTPVGCSAIRGYSEEAMEIKRMYTVSEKRGLGIAAHVLKELEEWARQLSYKKCMLETGLNQPEAISFYKKNNYSVIANFGRYKDSTNSICFEKTLIEKATIHFRQPGK